MDAGSTSVALLAAVGAFAVSVDAGLSARLVAWVTSVMADGLRVAGLSARGVAWWAHWVTPMMANGLVVAANGRVAGPNWSKAKDALLALVTVLGTLSLAKRPPVAAAIAAAAWVPTTEATVLNKVVVT